MGHKGRRLTVIVSGLFSMHTPQGVVTHRGPCMVVAEPCEKNVGYAHEDTLLIGLQPSLELMDTSSVAAH